MLVHIPGFYGEVSVKTQNENSLPELPPRIARLRELAHNLWWSWHRQSRDLFKYVDHTLWRSTGHNPVKILLEVPPERLKALTEDPLFLRRYDAVLMEFDRDMENGHLWFPTAFPGLSGSSVAYFSAEFGLHQSLPNYAGGLGVLAGDYCKEASDIGLPFTAVGFLYERGYFRQHLIPDGWQEAVYPCFDPEQVAVSPVMNTNGEAPLYIPVEVGDRIVYLQVWRVRAGRTCLYLMDAGHEKNSSSDRELTARLYGGDQEMRIQQEIVLGIGGLRVLRALGIDPSVYHLNEGHSAFVSLELVRELVETGISFEEAARQIQNKTVFTTHTPVPAGHDMFPFHLVEKYFKDYVGRLGITGEKFLELGSHGGRFNMTALALRMSSRRNGVSKLHGEVSRRMWHPLWPGSPEEKVPITHVTNGIHVPAWIGEAMHKIYREYISPDWIERHDDSRIWERIHDVPDEEMWNAHLHLKRKMMTLIRERARRQRVEDGMSAEQVLCAGTLLDPDALVVGFARRFAAYKRATLIFHDEERLKRLLLDTYRPVQFIFSGKAHPADDNGKRLIQQIYRTAENPLMGGRIAFIEDYDLHIARYLIQGVDVWMNTPRHPSEASGTSGQKAAVNAVPNLSVLDGWWAEGYNGRNGWAIEAVSGNSESEQDAADAGKLYRLLEEEVVPLFYKRDADDVPRGWVQVMKEAVRSSLPVFCTRRMVKEYTRKFYFFQAEGRKAEGSN